MCTTGRGGRAVLAAEDAVAEPEVERGADHDDQVAGAERLAAGLGDQQRVAAGDDAAAHAVGDRGDAERRRPARARPPRRRSAQTSVPRTSTGRSARPSSPATASTALGVVRGALDRAWPGRASTSALSKNSSIGTSRNTGPRCAAPARPNASSMPSAIASTVCTVRGLLGDRREDRRLVELLQAAGAPAVRRGAAADDDQRGAVELGLRDRR